MDIETCSKCGAEIRGEVCANCSAAIVTKITPEEAKASDRINKYLNKKWVFLLVLFLGVMLWANPTLRFRSEESIRDSLISATPLGSSVDVVLASVQKKFPEENPQLINDSAYDKGPSGYTIRIGEKSIDTIEMGWYFTTLPGLPMVTYVYASWAFDENDKLIDILVHKEIDAP